MMDNPSTIWQELPFNNMLKVMVDDERSFISPEAHCFIHHELEEDFTRHVHNFYANRTTSLIFVIDIGSDGYIRGSHYVYNYISDNFKPRQKERIFHHDEGEDEWDRYCRKLFQVLYKQFLL